MSYQVLARKWRPRSFAEMVGQQHVLRALINALDSDRLHHAYLFTGTRGVGKTTISRILAKCLNCEQGVTATPCGACGTCQEIDQGRFVDLIEVDAASRTKVDDTRELLDNVQYAPARGRYKIYLIDEVHMLSGHSFNALLKTLEEPPPHVKFLLATTDPQKIPITVLSRCLQFSLKRLPASLIQDHLSTVLEAESIEFEPAALAELGRAADGSMRDALSLLDQAIGFGGGSVRDEDVREMLGGIDRGFVFDLLDALVAQDGPAVLAVVERMSEQAPDFAEALNDLMAALHRLSLAQLVPDTLTEELPGVERLRELLPRLPAEDLQLYYQIALTGRRDLPLAPDPRTGFEMTLLRMLAFRPQGVGQGGAPATAVASAKAPAAASSPSPSSVPSSRPARPMAAALAAATGGGRPSGAANPAPAVAAPAPAPAPTQTPPAASQAAPWEDPVAPAAATARPPVEQAAPAPRASEPPAAAPQPSAAGGDDDWQSLVDRLRLGGMSHQLAMHCEWQGRDGERVRLRLAPEHDHLRTEGAEQRLVKALSDHFGTEIRLEFEMAKPTGETPAVHAERRQVERQRNAVEAIENDPHVAAMRELFGAEVVPNSIEPLKAGSAKEEGN